MYKENQLINGHLILKFTHKVGKTKYADCKCKSCGQVSNRRVSILVNAIGCKLCCFKSNVNHHSWKGFGEISHDLYTNYKHSAKAKELEFTVSIEYLWNLFLHQNRKCAFTGEELYFNHTYRGKTNKTASPDRIDSSKGYIEGNIQWVHKDINKLKKNFSDDRFIELCKKVAIHLKLVQES